MTETHEDDLLAELPGDLMMWVLIVSELLVFGAGLAAFLAVRIGDSPGFAAAQDHLDRAAGGLNTAVLVTSGLCAALANRQRRAGERRAARLWLAAAGALGCLFLWVKAIEYIDKVAAGDRHRNSSLLHLLLPANGISCGACRGRHRNFGSDCLA